MLTFTSVIIKINETNQQYFNYMKKLSLALLLLCAALTGTAQINRPKLVVGLMVDQMRWDYLYYYYDSFGEGGLKRLVDTGFSFEDTKINYIPTITAVGHSSVYTGSVPALHGIAGNGFAVDNKQVYCCADDGVKPIGTTSSAGKMSPHYLVASTIGDELKLATDFKAKVIGVAMKDRAAILPAGHSADAAYWYDNSVGHFVTSSFYMDKFPAWVEKFNAANATTPGKDVKSTPDGVTLTFKMAQAAIDNENLGADNITDLLAISISSTDIISHATGTRGKENKEVFMRLDHDLAQFIAYLDKKIGKDNYLLFLTADHGGIHNPNYTLSHRIPSGGCDQAGIGKALNAHLQKAFNSQANMVVGIADSRLYLNHPEIEKAGLNLQAIKDTAVNFLRSDKEIAFAVDYEKAYVTSVPAPIREQIVNGYNNKRSGDIVLINYPRVLPYAINTNYRGTSHGSWVPDDARIPFVLMGWNVGHGSCNAPTRIVDIAPTVCSMLHIQMPDACIGSSVLDKVAKK